MVLREAKAMVTGREMERVESHLARLTPDFHDLSKLL